MSDSKIKQPNRIPFESITQIDRWPLPSMGADGKVVPAAKKKNGAEASNKERIEDVTEPVTHKPLTADQLRQITEEAEREGYASGAEKGFAEGLEKGRLQGEKEGREQAYRETLAELDAEKVRLQQLSAALMEPVEGQDRALENIVVDMAAGLARHLLGRELKTDISALYGVVEKALASLPMGAGHVQIFVNPADVEAIEQLFSGRGKTWSFLGDNRLAPGGCRVESSDSIIDYSVERRLRDYFSLVEDGAGDDSMLEPVIDRRDDSSREKSSAPSVEAGDLNDGSADELNRSDTKAPPAEAAPHDSNS